MAHSSFLVWLAGYLNLYSFRQPKFQNLFHWYTTLGLYDCAEDILFRLIELGAEDATVTQAGIAFCETLRGKSDAELITGNLPCDEVESGFQEWLAL